MVHVEPSPTGANLVLHVSGHALIIDRGAAQVLATTLEEGNHCAVPIQHVHAGHRLLNALSTDEGDRYLWLDLHGTEIRHDLSAPELRRLITALRV
ncbi:hypothetical protein [Goodfellowiella coeruleoviolacea]|uniref:Uncharacterized protein n=1 Tax=Goodfellowiella coeruleoviolacea TaxID=334858 RepID=A0AAE3KFV6_9PSEU|nr:hypothetical protein [Goodfellowiella coeruleoviolacea]MCP2165352.1 hypothetical protein [Goodfellowiella coeruleoviolacea]